MNFLSAEKAAGLWGAAPVNPAVPLQRLAAPRVLWINPRAARSDPAWAGAQADPQRYGAHLLDTCARLLASGAGGDAIGHADRYGGSGIGRNGGSGRAVVVGGYHVKGVGRTPLVSHLTDHHHASGGAYLEECVREAIHAEIVAAEFPHGAVPVLAIIDTGLDQVWNIEDQASKVERRCLLVRPAFLRPAHFERAVGFIDGDPHAGSRDAARVRHVYAWAARGWGKAGFRARLAQLANHWAAQLAYGFVHRLSHSGHSTSNICMDGALVDFGASTSLPSWATTRLIPGGQPFGHEFLALMHALQPASHYWGRFMSPELGTPEFLGALLTAARERYENTMRDEILRLAGLSRAMAARLRAGANGAALDAAVGALLAYYQADKLDILEATPVPRLSWDLDRLWADGAPRHLAGLRRVIEDWLARAGPEGAPIALLAANNAFRARTRPSLFREESKAALFGALEGGAVRATIGSAQVTALIEREIAAARRDSRYEPEGGAMLGCAVGAGASLALFERGGALFAVREDGPGAGECEAVRAWSDQQLELDSGALAAAVAMPGLDASCGK